MLIHCRLLLLPDALNDAAAAAAAVCAPAADARTGLAANDDPCKARPPKREAVADGAPRGATCFRRRIEEETQEYRREKRVDLGVFTSCVNHVHRFRYHTIKK